MMRHVLVAGLIALAGQAQALSCLRPDVARTFHWAAEAEETYVVLWGAFTLDAPQRRGVSTSQTPQEQVLPARFSGKALGLDGFFDVPDMDVTVRLTCAGPWCGTVPEEASALAFVEVVEGGYDLAIGPCYNTIFAPVATADLARVERCIQGGACDDAGLSR